MRWRIFPVSVLLSSLLMGWWGQSSGLKICAFKLHSLNATKAPSSRVMNTLTRIVARYDICLLQNINDPKGSVLQKLVNGLSRYSPSYESHQYQFISSQGLGTSVNNMQQYVFIYRSETVSTTGQHQYKSQSFTRPPFAVRFQSKDTAMKELVLVAVHTDPSRAVQEIDRLHNVFQEVSKKWNTQMVMFLGNFNAGCAHMTRPNKKQISLFTTSGYYWLIKDSVDTTIPETTDCPYDRIVVHGRPFLKHIEPYSAQVFNFAKQFRMPMKEVLRVSDRFPVEVEVKSAALPLEAGPVGLILLSLCAVFTSCLPPL